MKEKMKKIVHWLGHAAFKLESENGVVLYIDPYQLPENLQKADAILITHDHFDHLSQEDVSKVQKEDTVIFGPTSVGEKVKLKFHKMSPGDLADFREIKIEAVPSYNTNKNFHPKENENLGYIVTIDGLRIYHAGDTDHIPEMKDIKADIALLPVGGTYTMNVQEAAEAARVIKPAIAVPMHYGTVAGSMNDGLTFRKICSHCDVEVLPLEK